MIGKSLPRPRPRRISHGSLKCGCPSCADTACIARCFRSNSRPASAVLRKLASSFSASMAQHKAAPFLEKQIERKAPFPEPAPPVPKNRPERHFVSAHQFSEASRHLLGGRCSTGSWFRNRAVTASAFAVSKRRVRPSPAPSSRSNPGRLRKCTRRGASALRRRAVRGQFFFSKRNDSIDLSAWCRCCTFN